MRVRMVIRVAAGNGGRAGPLVSDFVSVFGGKHVSVDANGEVMVEPQYDSNRAVGDAFDAIERWLDKTHLDSTVVQVNIDSYRLEERDQPATVGGKAWTYLRLGKSGEHDH